jgi:hypothetical protein
VLERARTLDARAQRFDLGGAERRELGGREIGRADRRGDEETVEGTQRNALARTTQLP